MSEAARQLPNDLARELASQGFYRMWVPDSLGGRSDAAIDRAARHGDGWLGVWCSPKRHRTVLSQIDAICEIKRRLA